MPVPNQFANVTTSIPLSQLDANFNTPITLGNTAIQLGNTVTTLNNMTLANVTISSGNVTITNVSVTTANVTTANIGTSIITTSETLNYGTANQVQYLNASKVLTGSASLTFDGTTFTTNVLAFTSISGGIAKTGTFTRNSGTTSGNVAYTGVGFTPSFIIFYAGIDTTRDFMIGAGNATAGRTLYDNFENTLGVNNQAVAFYYRRDIGAGNFDIQSATIASMDSDGFTLTYTRTRGGTGTANDIIVNYIAFR